MPELQELSAHLVQVIPAQGGNGVTLFVGGKETSLLSLPLPSVVSALAIFKLTV